MRPKVIIVSVALLAFLGIFMLICLFGIAYTFQQATLPSEPGSVNNPPPIAPGPVAPAADPTTGPVHVESDPSGAAVILDGLLVGTAPLELNPAAGPHSLRLEKEGFDPCVTALTRPAGGVPLKVSLRPIQYAELTVNSDPDGAELLIDGEFRGRTPLTVAHILPGPHEMIVRKANYSTQQSVLVLRGGEKKLLSDIRLENKLLLMLEATLEQEPRSIGNWMELAHFYYIQNDMARAAEYFTRARELAVQPPPAASAEMTEGEREALQNEGQWDRTKLMGEIKKHLEMGPTYYGNKLDYDKFRNEYAARTKEFDRWAIGWRDLHFIQNEAFAQVLQGHSARARDLFSDYVIAVNPKSGVGWGELVKAELTLGETAAAESHYALAKENLTPMPAPPEEMKYREIAWLDMARGWEQAADTLPASAAVREKYLVRAEECLNALDAMKLAAELTHLEARVARGQLFRLRGDVPGRVQYLTQALADTQKAIDALPAGSPDRRFLQEDLERLRIQRAWSALAAGDAKLAQTLAQALAKSGVAPDVAQQATALDAALRKGETPVEPKLTAPVGPTTPPAVPPAPPTPPAVVPTHDR